VFFVDGHFNYVWEKNEPLWDYNAGSPERAELMEHLESFKKKKLDIPLIIGGEEIRTGNTKKVIMPHDHGHVLAEYHLAGKKEIMMAVDAAMEAKKK
jgi:1-pyrroline-5-carboxylate dehydrogenase